MSEDTTTQQDQSAADPAHGGQSSTDQQPLGDAGIKALAAERARADTEAKRARDLAAKVAELEPLAALKPLADVLAGKQTGQAKTDLELLTERLDAQDKAIAAAQLDAARAKVAADKGLTPALAERLRGTTVDELAADADALLSALPAKPTGPKPDPTQGAQGGVVDVDSQIKEAQAKGDLKTVLRLTNQKLVGQMAPIK